MKTRCLLFAALLTIGAQHAVSAGVFSSPSNDIALQSNGGAGYSSLGNWDSNHTPVKLNDGNRDGNFAANALYHSNGPSGGGSTPPADFGVTLSGFYDVTSINLFTRTDCCGTRIDGGGTVPFTAEVLLNGVVQWSNTYSFISAGNNISISDTDPSSPTFGDSASGRIITLPAGVHGNDVRIIQNYTDPNQGYINIAEVEAFGQHVPEPSSFVLAGLAAVGLLVAARRRRKA